jgi:hypothetical protein
MCMFMYMYMCVDKLTQGRFNDDQESTVYVYIHYICTYIVLFSVYTYIYPENDNFRLFAANGKLKFVFPRPANDKQ